MKPNLKQDLRSIRIVHAGLLLGIFFFLIITAYLNHSLGGGFLEDGDEPGEFSIMLLIVFNVLFIGSVTGGLIVFGKKIKNIEKLELSEKLKKFREASLVRAATIEGAAFMFIVGFMITGVFIFFYEALVVLLLLLFYFPTNNRIAKEIKHDFRGMF